MPEPDDWSMFGEFPAPVACALMNLVHLHIKLNNYETRDPRIGDRGRRWRWLQCGGVVLRYIKSRGVWRVKEPKQRALELVAARYNIEPATLRDWERKLHSTSAPLGEFF
jgi:hypothetical protein